MRKQFLGVMIVGFIFLFRPCLKAQLRPDMALIYRGQIVDGTGAIVTFSAFRPSFSVVTIAFNKSRNDRDNEHQLGWPAVKLISVDRIDILSDPSIYASFGMTDWPLCNVTFLDGTVLNNIYLNLPSTSIEIAGKTVYLSNLKPRSIQFKVAPEDLRRYKALFVDLGIREINRSSVPAQPGLILFKQNLSLPFLGIVNFSEGPAGIVLTDDLDEALAVGTRLSAIPFSTIADIHFLPLTSEESRKANDRNMLHHIRKADVVLKSGKLLNGQYLRINLVQWEGENFSGELWPPSIEELRFR